MKMKARHIKQQQNRTVISVYLAVTIAFKLSIFLFVFISNVVKYCDEVFSPSVNKASLYVHGYCMPYFWWWYKGFV